MCVHSSADTQTSMVAVLVFHHMLPREHTREKESIALAKCRLQSVKVTRRYIAHSKVTVVIHSTGHQQLIGTSTTAAVVRCGPAAATLLRNIT